MKINRVTVTGFGPFRDTETADFDAFDDDGIFLITGCTGAGKTSILDAVTFALFGTVPRYAGQAGNAVRCDRLAADKPCHVELEFSVGERRFKVTRAPAWERPKQRGTGTTSAPARAELDELLDGRWERLQTRAVDTSRQINDLIRMNSSQFQQVVLLAQGQFQEFLVADTDKRRSLLQTLFGTKRFADYVDMLSERARDLKRQLDDAQHCLTDKVHAFASWAGVSDDSATPEAVDDTVEQWCARIVAAQAAELGEATRRQQALRDSLDVAKEELAQATEIAARQQRRARALDEQARLAGQAQQITATKAALHNAARADTVAPAIEASEDADTSAAQAERARHDAEAGYLTVAAALPETVGEVAESISELNQLIGRLRPQLEVEKSLPALRRAAQLAAEKVTEHDDRTAADKKQRESLTEQMEQLRHTITALDEPAGTFAEAKAAADEAARRLQAAQRAEQLSADLQLAAQDDQAAVKRASAASDELSALLRRQLSGYAGDLAQGLVAGELCPVCGSLDHPKLAELAADHVDQSDIDRAQAAVELTYAQAKKAAARSQQLEERRQSEFLAAGRQSVTEAEAVASQAQQVMAEAAAAGDELRRSRNRLTRLQEQTDAITASLDQAQELRAGLVIAQTTAQTGLAEAERAVTEARGDQASVHEAMAEAQLRRKLSELLLEARTQHQGAVERASSERERLAAALADAGFADAGEAKKARISRPEQERLRAEVERHAAGIAAVKLTLESPELIGLPAQPVDLDAPKQTLAKVDAELEQTRTVVATIQPRLAELRRLSGEIADRRVTIAEDDKQFQAVDRLARTLRGLDPNIMRMELETFVLAAQLEEIVQVANRRLYTMTDGRYILRHSDAIEKNRGKWGLGLEVLDAHTGGVRGPDSLSGGEKFQASLALALGLAEVVTNRAGGMRLDTLFIDEGFGSLDAETLDVTMATLDNLREGGRTVGLISHVASMKESIPAQLSVEKVPGGWSVIRQESSS